MENYFDKACVFYAVGSDEKSLLAYDEFSSGDPRYYTDDLLMVHRFTSQESKDTAEMLNKKVYLVEIRKYTNGEVKTKIDPLEE